MEFLNPHDTSEEDLKEHMEEIATTTIFSYPYLLQEVRRCRMENKVLIIVDSSHHIDWDYARLCRGEKPEEIEAFILKWAGKKP